MMLRTSILFFFSMIMLSGYAQNNAAFKTGTTDTFYGKVVSDPYRSLEDTGNAAVKAWMKQQATHADAVFQSIPGRQKIYDAFVAANKQANAEDIRSVMYGNGKYYVTKTLPGSDYPSLYEIDEKGKSRLLVDPHKAHPEIKSPNVSLSDMLVSPNSPYLLYYLIVGGYEDEPKMVLRNLHTGAEQYDTAYLSVKEGMIAFDPDSANAFYYQRLPNFNRKDINPMRWWDSLTIWRHVIGTDRFTDQQVLAFDSTVVARRVDDIVMLVVEKDLNYVFAIVKNQVAKEYRIYVAPKSDFKGTATPWKKMIDFDDKISQYAMLGDYLYLMTSKGASNGKVLRLDLRSQHLADATVILPASKRVLQDMNITSNAVLITAIEGGQGRLYSIPHGSTVVQPVVTPLQGSSRVTWANRSYPDYMISITSWVRPVSYYTFQNATRQFAPSMIVQAQPAPPAPLEVKEVMVKSHDGTLVPMTIIHKKGLKLDGTHHVTLSGYGAYGQQNLPGFWPENMIAYNMGRISAIARVRGGGEYGEEWHLAGMKATKPNTWKDFIACAQYLVDHHYASPKNLVARGGSAGGITVGRAITERPDLFAGAIIDVGGLDMVRFETSPNGYGNIPEFGSVVTEEGFNALYAMSTYHHIKKGTKYPTVVFRHGVNDNRVPVWSSLKTAAFMQEASTSGKRVLLKLDYESGHGGQDNLSSAFGQAADNLSFYFWMAGMPDFQPTVK